MEQTTKLTIAIAIALGLSATSCSRGAYLTDDTGRDPGEHVMLQLQLLPTIEHDDLSPPYALGALFAITAHSNYLSVDESQWSVEAADSSILAVASSEGNTTHFRALSVGTTQVHAVDESGDVVHSLDIEVREPDAVELYATGPLLVGRGFEGARVDRVQLLPGGEAAFLLGYLAGGTRLSGYDVVDPTLLEAGGLISETQEVWRGYDVLRLSASDGQVQASLRLLAGSAAAELPLSIAEPSRVASLELMGEREDDVDDGSPLALYAQPRDGEGDPIFGAPCRWTVGEVTHTTLGDLVTYDYARENERQVTATYEGVSNVPPATVHSEDEGSVSTSTDLDCSAAGSPRHGGAASLVLLLMVAGAVRRRR